MPRATAKTAKTKLPPDLAGKVAALPKRPAEPARLVPVEDVVARQAANAAMYRKLFSKPAKAKGAA